MDTNLKANAVILRLRKLHQQTRELDESYQNVSSNSSQRGSTSRIRKTSSNGKYLQPQIPPTTKQDDLLKTSKKNKKDIDVISDSNSYEQRVEIKQKSYQPKKNIIGYNEMPNQRPPFSNAKKNLISTIEDTTKQSNQRPPFSNARKNQINNIDEPNKQSNQRSSFSNARKNLNNNIDEPNKQSNQKPPFSTGKANYSSAANDTSKQKSKLTNRNVKSTNNNLVNKKSEQLKKQDQPIRKQNLSKKIEQATKTEISSSTTVNKNYVSRRKISNVETDQNPPKQLTDVEKATKEVERNPKSSRFINSRINSKENANDDVPSYDFKTKQNDTIQNVIINRNDRINEAYKKIPQARTIVVSNDADDDDKSDELLKEVVAFLRKSKQVNLNSTILQNPSSPVKKNPVSRVQQKNKPFSWGSTLKSINNNDNNNKNSSSAVIKANDSNYKIQNKNNIFDDSFNESDELNLFFTPEKDFSKGIKNQNNNNNAKISAYSNSNLKATLLDRSDSASIQNDVYLSTESETEVASDLLTRKSTNDYNQNDQFVNIMRKKLDKVLNSDSTELSASSDIGQAEINKLTSNSNRNNRILYSDESDELLNQPQQRFSVIKNPNSKISSISKYGKVSSSNLSRFAQNNTQKELSSDVDDYLSSDSKSEEIFSIPKKTNEDTNIIKSRNAKYNRNKNQDKLTVDQIKNNYLDSATDNSSTKSADYEEFPDLIISNKSPKKAIKDYNIVKKQVLNDIQSSDSSSPEVLNNIYSKNNSSSKTSNKLANNKSQKNSFDQFDTSRLSNIVLSEFDESSNIINGDKDDEILSNPESQIETINKNQFKQFNNSISDDDDEIPEVKQAPKPIENISANNKQKMAIIQDEEEEDDNEIPVIKKHPQLEPQVVAASNAIQKKKLNSIFLDEDDEEEDDEIPAVKKPPQPEPLITSGMKPLNNKDDVDQQEMSDIIDDEYPDEIPMPKCDNLNNKNKEIDDLDSDDVEINSKIEKKKSSPLHVLPPNGVTYFSKVDKNEKFQPLKFDENDEIKENNVNFDKEQRSDDEIIEIEQNHLPENDSNEEFIDDSFDEKLKMARNTISKIKGNQQHGQKSFNLFRSNSFEEEEKLENCNLILEEEEEKMSEQEEIVEEKQIQPNKQEKKQLRSNLIDDDFNENQIETSSKKGKKELQINDDDDMNDDESLNSNHIKPNYIKTDNNQLKADDINEVGKSDNFKQSKFKNVFSDEEDYDDENESLDTNKFKSSSTKSNNYLNDRFSIDINNETKINDNSKQSKFKNTVGDEEDENEQFKLGENKKIESDKERKSIRLENNSNNSSDDAQFIFENINYNDKKVEKQNKCESKKENDFENEEINNDNKEKDIFGKKYIGSNKEEEIKQPINDKSNNKNEEEEEINNDIIINPKIELEEDEEEEEAPIDPYFLDTNISDDSDSKENHDTKEKETKKLDSQNEKKQNQDINNNDDMNDFESLKRNFLKQDSDDENEEEDQIINISNKTNDEQTHEQSNLHEEIVNKIAKEEEKNEIEVDINNEDDEDDEDDEEEDQILQKLKDLYSQNKSALDNDDQISSIIGTKTKDIQNSNKNNSHNFLKFLEIEEEEEEENNDISLSEKISKLINISNNEDEEEEIKENQDENNKTIKISAIKDVQNTVQNNKSDNSTSKANADYNNKSDDESALDFLKQEDFLEDHLFLAKNKNINKNNEQISQNDNIEEEEEENDEDIQNDVPENNEQKETLNNQLNKKVDSLIEDQNSENEEEEEEEEVEKYAKQISKFNEKIESITKVSSYEKKFNDENKEINQTKAIDLSQNSEAKYSSIPNDIEEEIKNKLQKSNETNIINPNDQKEKVEYEYEYEEEEILEQITISNNENVTKVVTNDSQIEIKETQKQNETEIKEETQKHNENEENKQMKEINEVNVNNLKNENVEYEYEYEEEIVEKLQEMTIEIENKNKLNQFQVEIKKEESDKKDNEISINSPKVQKVEYEYEYEEEIIEQPQKITINKAKKEEIKNENDEEESFDEEAIIQRLQNFEGLDFNKDFEKNLKNDIDLFEEEEEENISDDSLIKKLDQRISLMENEAIDENDDENIDGETIQKRMQDLLNIEISDDESEGDDEYLNLEKKDD